MATRENGAVSWDHGAQYFTVRDDRFDVDLIGRAADDDDPAIMLHIDPLAVEGVVLAATGHADSRFTGQIELLRAGKARDQAGRAVGVSGWSVDQARQAGVFAQVHNVGIDGRLGIAGQDRHDALPVDQHPVDGAAAPVFRQ